MNNILSFGYTSKIVPIKPVNSQFTLCKCWMLALGNNQNKTHFSKDAVDDALPTLFNIPVVGHLFEDKDGNIRMGGHDMAIEKNSDGKYVFKVLTVPYGVVPQQDNAHYEEVTEENGVVNTYFVVDIILWTGRYPELLQAKYDEEIYFAQSMEIYPLKTNKQDDYLDVEKFEYSALCLLGKSDDKSKNVEPCFSSARVEPYDFALKDEWIKLYGEFKEELAKAFAKQNFEKGGEEALDTEAVKRIVCEFGLPADTVLPFEVTEDMTEESLREKLKQAFSADNGAEDAPADEGETSDGEDNVPTEEQHVEGAGEDNATPSDTTENYENNGEPEKKLFAVEHSYTEKRNKLCTSLNALCSWTETGYIDYYLMDFDSAYAYCHLVACSENSDPVDKTVRIPYSIVEEKAELDVAKTEDVRQVWLTKEEEEVLEAKKVEFNELKEYKAKRIEEDRQKAYAAILEEFNDLSEVEEYKTVVKDAMAFASAEDLTEKLYAIRGRYAKLPAKKPVGSIKIPVGFGEDTQPSEMAAFIQKYSRK